MALREVDRLRRFLFEQAPLRGHWVRLEDSWAQAHAHQSHPPAVLQLLGEAMAAVSLLAATLKFQGTLTLQVRGAGPLSLLVTQCTHEQQLRGVAQLRDAAVVAEGADLASLIGAGQMLVTIDTQGGAPPWQGIVPLDGATLAECLQGYFENSEQLPTRLVLAADGHRVAGLLLQKLPAPASAGEAEEGRLRELWDEAALLLGTLSARELLDTEASELLRRLFAEHDLRLFDGQPVRFECRCSPQRVAGLLHSLGQDEVRALLAEEGEVRVTCEFCHRPYRYDAIDVAQLFAATPAADVPDSLN